MKRVYLEITNMCNLNCPFCTQNKGQSFMTLNEIDDYTTKIKEVCDYLYLHVLGEPLFHPCFEEILNILDRKDFKLQLVTNGTLLNQYPNLLKHKCIRKLSISIHSINNLVSIDDNYFEIINKMIESNEGKSIELRFYDKDKLNQRLITYLNTLYEKYNVKESKKENSYIIKDNVYIYFQGLFKWPNINNEYISESGRCLGLIDQIAILCNGDVTSCCLDTMGINKFGNLKKNTLKEILCCEKYQNAVECLKQNKLKLNLCKHCTYHMRFSRNNN